MQKKIIPVKTAFAYISIFDKIFIFTHKYNKKRGAFLLRKSYFQLSNAFPITSILVRFFLLSAVSE